MTMQTISEKLFENFCIENKIPLDLIATESDEGQKTPDYIIDASGNTIVVEIPVPDQRHLKDRWAMSNISLERTPRDERKPNGIVMRRSSARNRWVAEETSV
ncbi:MAG: hypothetical protein KAJ19_21650 [Gammaproteobacteria bacterium]|nr:hypothetical protein [Gammaproteobacteria bacterium]